MAQLFEDLPLAVQLELRTKRNSIEGWEPHSHATVDQWQTYYAMLSETGQRFLVDNLLELSQLGSLCAQADHQASLDASWVQLREVVSLHNARVDEATMLRQKVAELTELLAGKVPAEAIAEALVRAERDLNPQVIVEFPADPTLQAHPELLPVEPAGGAPADRRLYVVKDPPASEDGA